MGAEAIEPLRRAFGAYQRHVAHGPADAAVAVVKRVQGDQPEVGKARFEKACEYVVRPQFFVLLMTLLRNAALNAVKCKSELALVRSRNVDG